MKKKIIPAEERGKEYKPKIALCRLHTAGKTLDEYREELQGQGFTLNQMKHMLKADYYFDGLEIYVSLWDWDNHESWHLWNWEEKDDEQIMKALFEADFYNPAGMGISDFREFKEIWKSGTYDPGCTYTFTFEQVEILRVVQEEENPHDSERTRRIVDRAKGDLMTRNRKNRMQRRSYRKGMKRK